TAKCVVQFFLKHIESELIAMKRISISGIGKLQVSVKKERMGRNPKTLEDCIISSRVAVTMSKTTPAKEGELNKGLSSKTHFINKIKEEFSFSNITATKVHQIFFDAIRSISSGDVRMELRGFGVFYPNSVKAKTGRNPKTGESVNIEEGVRVLFRLSTKMRARLEQSGSFGSFPAPK
ncbi:MAG: hypothetical protein HAW67_04385, partial [Endozoicomonadaceae bacterium]|nr:hypothetical protein [Endozoicomonadaceae bacterium]